MESNAETKEMECSESIELLSDYYEGALGEEVRVRVYHHLIICKPCAEILSDLKTIVLTAMTLRIDQGFPTPDENAVWQRLPLPKRDAQ